MSEAYVVEVKPSARRTNGAVGRTVNRAGARHQFDDRDAAEDWADDLAERGDATVWIRAANPNDGRDVDAYLMGRRRPASGDRGGAPTERDSPAGDQTQMLAYEREDA